MSFFKQIAPDQSGVVLEITGMTCPACAERVRKALQKSKGVRDVNIRTWSDGRATIQGEHLSVADLLKLAREAGYRASLHSQSTPSAREKLQEDP